MATEESQLLTEQERVIFEAIEIIDKSLEANNTKLSLRPLKAANLFVEHFVVEVNGGDKENYTEQSWFAVIYHHVKDWYNRTYGALMTESSDGVGHAVVSVRGIPVAFDVPLTRIVIEEEGKTPWLCFPNKIEETEDPKSWLRNPPPLSNLAQKDLNKLDRVCARTAVALRKIQLNVQGLSGSSAIVDGFVTGIMPEVEAAAVHILRNKPEAFGLAAWSLQMALEKTLKALAIQHNKTYKRTHDLFALYDLVEANLAPMKRDVMEKFLREADVIAARYGQGKAVKKDFILGSYLTGIEFIATATEKFERTRSIAGARILLGMPPWLSLYE